MKVWYIAKSKPQKENWLSSSLTSLGVEVFYPRIVSQRRGRRLLEPLFPTYLFCRLEADTLDWPAIRWAPGLNYFLGVDGHPTHVKDDMVEYIGRRVELWNGNGNGLGDLKPGQRVTVTNGPFSGLDGIFEGHVNSRQRCRILLQVVGRTSPVELRESDLAVTISGR